VTKDVDIPPGSLAEVMLGDLVLPGHHVAPVVVQASTKEVVGRDEGLEGLHMSLAEPRGPLVFQGPPVEGTPCRLGVPLTDGAFVGGRPRGLAPR